MFKMSVNVESPAGPEQGVPTRGEMPRRSDAQRNRERIVEVALAELARDPDVPMSVIARNARVGQATLYRNFPDREALLWAAYDREVQRLIDGATELLERRAPDEALREWLQRLARFARAKAGIASALRQVIYAMDAPSQPGHALIVQTIDVLLEANRRAGTIRPDVTVDDFILAIAGIWQITSASDYESRAGRLLDLVMAGLQAAGPAAQPA